MAGNKFNTEFSVHKPVFYTLQYGDKYGNIETFQGTPKQIIKHILNQQL